MVAFPESGGDLKHLVRQEKYIFIVDPEVINGYH
jgi:hypothetical protein